jgi:hypothetical protein
VTKLERLTASFKARAAARAAPKASAWRTSLEQQRERALQQAERRAQGRRAGRVTHERALTQGLIPESTRTFSGCNACHDMPWRRHRSGCVGCGKRYAIERVEHAIQGPQSSAAGWEDAA